VKNKISFPTCDASEHFACFCHLFLGGKEILACTYFLFTELSQVPALQLPALQVPAKLTLTCMSAPCSIAHSTCINQIMCTDKSVAYDNILNWKPWHTHTHCKEVGIMF